MANGITELIFDFHTKQLSYTTSDSEPVNKRNGSAGTRPELRRQAGGYEFLTGKRCDDGDGGGSVSGEALNEALELLRPDVDNLRRSEVHDDRRPAIRRRFLEDLDGGSVHRQRRRPWTAQLQLVPRGGGAHCFWKSRARVWEFG